MTNSDTGLGTTGISPTGNTAGTVTDSGLAGSHLTESRQVEVTGVHVPVVPIEGGDAAAGSTGVRHGEMHTGHHEGEKKPMGEKLKEHIPGRPSSWLAAACSVGTALRIASWCNLCVGMHNHNVLRTGQQLHDRRMRYHGLPMMLVESTTAAWCMSAVLAGTQAHKEHKAEKQLAEGRI
jgi:hypothetical protein